ncbi:tubulin polyglutamylase TTLL5 isoform X1 [Scyliorhinus canicula]|uniref:tubulin polyglutamylase TTLL5 isoform X1 n=1 Tax=Scyliorhinus canicula TaxID=7830 RepID=UPI0018F5994A|nr:tubulin polyglutamylase TTLL5 isoform X1 [Scyliorhinus canicula]
MPAVSHVPEDSSTASDEEEHEDHPCIRWGGGNRMIPTLVFYADGIVTKDGTLRLIGERYHLAYKIVRTESRLVRSILTVHGFHEVHPNSNDFNLMWTGTHLKPYVLRTLLEFQKVNHFPRSYELTRKDRLYKNIQRMQQTYGFKHFNIVPQAYILPSEFQELWTAHTKEKGPWIVKPVASSRGRGVYLVTNPNQIATDESILVSRYIRSPLLIDDFKFDVRLYVLVTSYDPLVVYLYEEGLTRFATVKYDRATRNIKNQFMHLTNYSINKKSCDYVSCDDPEVEDYGNKWSMSAMLRYLKQEGTDTATLMAQIEDLIIKALIAAELHIASASKMFVPHRGNCFELYGFDVLIDSNLKPWLLEVNLSPSLACDAPLDLKIKASMLSDMFTLVGFVCQNPIVQQGRPAKSGFELGARPKYHKALSQQQPMSANDTEVKGKTLSGKERIQGAQGLSTLRLTVEEVKVVRRTMEENERKGGFIRIFPTADTWELYGQFLEHKTTLNYVLATRLFAGRKRKPATSARSRNSVTQNNHMVFKLEVLTIEVHKHVQQYERKLLSLEARRRKQNRGKGRGSSHKVPVVSSVVTEREVEGEGEEEAEDDEEISEDETETTGPTCPIPALAQAAIAQRLRANSEGVQKALELTESKFVGKQVLGKWTQTKEEQSDEQPTVNLLEMLQQGGNLSKVQARLAFSAYLHRVQLRLLRERPSQSETTTSTDQEEEQMELVIRFLKRAASNLQQSVTMTLPSRRLPISERRHILAQQLGVFLHSYNKETDRMIKKSQMDLKLETCVQQEDFQVFVSKASENDLEELLTIYTHKNKSASVFLGTQARNGKQSNSEQPIGSKTTAGPAVPKEEDSSASDGSGDGRLRFTESSSMQVSSSHNVHPPHTALQQEGNQPLPTSLPTCTTPVQDLAALLAEAVGRTGTGVCRTASATPTSHHPQYPSRLHRPNSSTLPIASASSFQAATQIYSRKLSRPVSATAGSGVRSLHRQHPPTVGTLGEGDYHPAPSEDLNHEAISIVLQRLAAKQKARQYSASSHLSLLTQQLSNMNLASGALSRGNMFTTPNLQTSNKNLNPICTAHPDLQTLNSASVDRISSATSRGSMDGLSWEHEVECAYNMVTGVTPKQRYQPTSGSQQLQYALQQLQQQQQQSRQLLNTSRARHQAILAENQFLAMEASTQWSAPLTTATQISGSSSPCNHWQVTQQKLEAAESSSTLLPPRPPQSNKQGTVRKTSTQRVPRSVAFNSQQSGRAPRTNWTDSIPSNSTAQPSSSGRLTVTLTPRNTLGNRSGWTS